MQVQCLKEQIQHQNHPTFLKGIVELELKRQNQLIPPPDDDTMLRWYE